MFRPEFENVRNENFPPSAVGTILEVEPVDPLLEVSNLTDDSKMFQSPSTPLKVERKNHFYFVAPPSEEITSSKRGIFSRFETPTKFRRAFTRTTASTPETATMDDDSDGLDGISDDSKFHRQGESEVVIRVDDYKEVTFEKLVDQLGGNTELTGVEIHRLSRMGNQRKRTDEEMSVFFDTLQGIPNLKKLVLNSFSPFDLELIGSLIKNLKSLEKVHIHLVSGTVDSSLLDTMAEAPALRVVSLDVPCSFPLHLLLTSRSLTHVIVPSERFHFEEGQLVFAMNALENNGSLQVLDLKPKLTASEIRLLSFGIRRNSELKVLRFSFLADEADSGPALLHFGNALAQNKCLQAVQNHYGDLVQLSTADAYLLLKLVENHPTLKDCTIFDRERAEKAMREDKAQEKQSRSFLSRMMCDSDLTPLCPFPDTVTRFFQTPTPNLEETKLNTFTTSIMQMHDQLRQSFSKLMIFRPTGKPQQQ